MAIDTRAGPQAQRRWARALVEANRILDPLTLVGGVVASVALALLDDEPGAQRGAAPAAWRDRDALHRLTTTGPGPLDLTGPTGPPPGGAADVWLPGVVHEQAVSAAARSARGAWYTPEPVVRGLVAMATADGVPPELIGDPTCGGGAFLLAALDRLVELGVAPAEAVARVGGLDIDAGAIQVSRWSISLWAAANGADLADRSVDGRAIDLTVGDALAGQPNHWPARRVIVGNPPFATPLRSGAIPPEVEDFRVGREELLGPYTDLAAMHLLAAVERCGPGSAVALVQPQSVLSGRDSGPLRDHLDVVAPVHGLWAVREPVFDAGVRACAVVLKPGAAAPPTVALASGPEVEPAGAEPFHAGGWSGYAARALGAPALPAWLPTWLPGEEEPNGSEPAAAPAVPAPPAHPAERAERVEVGSAGGSVGGPVPRLGSVASATAGFRDEYYDLVAACREWDGPVGGEPNRLLTVGSVEPLAATWGIEPIRFGGRRWRRPCIDLEDLSPKVLAWTERQSRPKLVLATQSRVLEPLIDRDGSLIPATPLVAVHAEPELLPAIAAVLLAPPVVAWAWQRWFGAALTVDALKLAARQVLELPLPADSGAWQEASSLVEAADSSEAGGRAVAEGWATAHAVAVIMNRAYGADASVLRWWSERATPAARRRRQAGIGDPADGSPR